MKLRNYNFKWNENIIYESTNQDSEEVYIMNCFYYHGDDEYDEDNEDEGPSKEDRRNESDENNDEIGTDGNNHKSEDIMVQGIIYPGTCMIIGMIVDVLMNAAMTESPRKDTGKYGPKYSENINKKKNEEDTIGNGTIKQNSERKWNELYLS